MNEPKGIKYSPTTMIHRTLLNQLYEDIEKFKSEVEKLTQQLNSQDKHFVDLNILIDSQNNQIKILKETLEFYADINNYCDNDMLGIPSHMVNHSDDEFISTMEDEYKYDRSLGGMKAREALKKLKELTEK